MPNYSDEGRVVGEDSDAGFHEDLLKAAPPAAQLNDWRQQAVNAGLTPAEVDALYPPTKGVLT